MPQVLVATLSLDWRSVSCVHRPLRVFRQLMSTHVYKGPKAHLKKIRLSARTQNKVKQRAGHCQGRDGHNGTLGSNAWNGQGSC